MATPGPHPPRLGVLQLNTTFPRPAGDVGNPLSWGSIPVVIRVVEEANSDLVVGGGWGEALVNAFVREGRRMMAEDGCVAFVTSCGFLATMHPLLAARLPFMGTTAILQVPWLQQSFFPTASPSTAPAVGILTFKKSALTAAHLAAVGAHPATPVYGLPEDADADRAVFKAVLEGRALYDFERMAAEVVGAAERLVAEWPSVRAVVLECTNMPPFARRVERETGRRVWDVLTLGRWLYEGAVGADWERVQRGSNYDT